MTVMVADVTERDLRAAMSVLQALAEQSADSRSFVVGALDQLTDIVASDLTTLSLCDLDRGTRRVVARHGEALSQADRVAFDQHFHEHPLVRFHGAHPAGPTQRMTDCVDKGAFRDSALYADYYRRIGINYVMALPLMIDAGNVISVVFNRSHCDFKDGERAILDGIRRPLAAIYRNLVACEDAGIGLKRITHLAADGGWHVMRVTMAGRILDASSHALALLRRFFPRDPVGRGSQAPALLSDWFARSRSWGLDRPATHHGQHFTMSRGGTKLIAHFVADPLDAAAGYLLLKCERLDVQSAHLARLPLTEREREILALVAVGKTNAEIGIVLAISGRTVQKHLEHIFQKLGVETRTAAAVRALSVADAHASPEA